MSLGVMQVYDQVQCLVPSPAVLGTFILPNHEAAPCYMDDVIAIRN